VCSDRGFVAGLEADCGALNFAVIERKDHDMAGVCAIRLASSCTARESHSTDFTAGDLARLGRVGALTIRQIALYTSPFAKGRTVRSAGHADASNNLGDRIGL
jgi:hypothetical protein